MKISYDLDAAKEEAEVLLYVTAGGQTACCLARRHWFVEEEADKSRTRRLAWQSTWDGSALPAEWAPFAWAAIPEPDPAAIGDVV